MFPAIERSRNGDILPDRSVVDEIISVMMLSPLSQSNLRARLSWEISCTDASPTGGATAIATAFKSQFLKVPDAKPLEDTCCVCGEQLGAKGTSFPCSRRCGAEACCAQCIFTHSEGQCLRDELDAPTFAERFAGPNFPLTQAVALQGIAIQPPLDIKIHSYPWDFFTEVGKSKLDNMERDSSLSATHWAPECKTFSAARGKPITLRGGRRIAGPRALRSKAKPWGLPNLTTEESFQVRRGNAMAKRSIQGLKDAKRSRRIGTLEHPYNSFIWDTDDAKEVTEDPDFFVAVFSNCCYGGWRTKWTCLVTNDEILYQALHKPECPGHDWLQPYQVHETPHGLIFDTEEESEYPWELCLRYAEALKRSLVRKTPSPVGTAPRDSHTAIYSAIKRATRGLQDPEVAYVVAKKVNQMVETMVPGTERDHLSNLLREVSSRGCDIKLSASPDSGEFTLMAPYPAFVWLWRTLLAYRWMAPQHINTLEVSAFLVEIRRRARDIDAVRSRFINITDSQVTFHCLTKGRSSSPRLNRVIRRISAVSFAADITPYHLWTISKWNFADHGSRRFESKK